MRNDKKHLKNRKWRKISLFFAAFFCISLILISCKKHKNPIGADVFPPGTSMSSNGVDTFSLITYTVPEDSVVTLDPAYNLLGSYVDEVFGKVTANFYTQITLSGFEPDFGDLNNVVVDSVVMAFEYGGYYGKLDEQLFEVYEVTEEITRDSSYTAESTLETDGQNLVLTDNNQGSIVPNDLIPAIVGEDTLSPQLRIPLEKSFGKNLLTIAQNSSSDADFLESFKGLFFTVNNPSQSVGEGGVLYLESTSAASKLTVYYTSSDEGESKYDFIITGNGAVDFNHFEVDQTGTTVEQVMNDTISGLNEYYAHAFLSRGKIDFPTIDSLDSDIIIHSAEIELPVSFYPMSNYEPSKRINISAEIFEGDKTKYVVASAEYSEIRKAYVADLRPYIQNVVKGEVKNQGVFLSPDKYISSAERIVFNGPHSSFKKQPKLNIVFTKL